ncbi:TetR/AcrR family transcriptional regulator [Amycolatopsis pigmentata]|uniref:TetR/AcrR family transcriptional regulator n=1 Tax=Amycolatopsis pigmentata TaxID=450801 RepID=A0ABW5FR72_9PSEU
MPKVSPEYRESRRQEILHAARALFAKQGFAGTSMSDLVSATGLSIGALYRYFPSKTDLVMAVVEGRDGTVDGSYDDSESPGELLSRLLCYVAPGTPAGTSQARLTAQIWGDAAVNPGFAAKVRERHGALVDQLAGRLRATRRKRTAGHRDESALAEVLLAALIGFAALVATESPVDPQAFERTLLQLLADA